MWCMLMSYQKRKRLQTSQKVQKWERFSDALVTRQLENPLRSQWLQEQPLMKQWVKLQLPTIRSYNSMIWVQITGHYGIAWKCSPPIPRITEISVAQCKEGSMPKLRAIWRFICFSLKKSENVSSNNEPNSIHKQVMGVLKSWVFTWESDQRVV